MSDVHTISKKREALTAKWEKCRKAADQALERKVDASNAHNHASCEYSNAKTAEENAWKALSACRDECPI